MKIRNIFLTLAIVAGCLVVTAQTSADDARVRDRITQAVMKVYNDQLEKEPGDYNTRFARANQLFYNREYAQALADANEVLKQMPAKDRSLEFDTYLLKARIYDAQGNYTEEIEALRVAMGLNAKSMACVDMLAKVSLKVNDLDAAEHNFKTILRDTPMNYDAMYGLAQVEVLRNNYEKAITQVDKAVELFTAEPQVYINRSDILYKMNQYEAAAQDLITALSVGNNTSGAVRALASMSDLKYDAVMNALSKSIDIAPRVGTFYYLRSSLAIRHFHYAQAARELKNIIANDFYNDASIYADLATCQLELTQYDEALVNINKAIAIDDKNPDYYLTKACIERNSGQGNNYDAAIASIDKALAINSNYSDALMAKARVLIAQRKEADALKCINAIIDREPVNGQALLLRGWVNKYRLKNAVAAQKDFETILDLGNDIYSMRGFALHELGKDMDARDWAKQIIQDGILPGGYSYYVAAALYSNIGDVAMGDKGKAIECLRSALANGFGSLYELKVNEDPCVNLKIMRSYVEFNEILQQNEDCFKERR
ncbi:MAG: tetratricopeptide repeat protein [Muribaculaceae bacterium]|nr:tetratricopeptide repeat protein [Muribaculaceae bacterium]